MRLFRLLFIAVMLAIAVPAFAAPITETPLEVSSSPKTASLTPSLAAETNVTPIYPPIVAIRATNVRFDGRSLNGIVLSSTTKSTWSRSLSMQHVSRERHQIFFCWSVVPNTKLPVVRMQPAPSIDYRE